MSSSYHIALKTFIEVSHTNNIHNQRKVSCCCYICKYLNRLFSERMQKMQHTLVSISPRYISNENKATKSLLMGCKFSCIHADVSFDVPNIIFV